MSDHLLRRKAAFQYIFETTSLKFQPVCDVAQAWAPVNIALIKYWGKRDQIINLPLTDSFSIALSLGTRTRISRAPLAAVHDIILLNGKEVSSESSFSRKLVEYLSFFRPDDSWRFVVETENDVPTASGLASSASGFAACMKALDQFFGWNLPLEKLSYLARLGSGSASRSLYSGFSLWKKGELDSGIDSYAIPLPYKMPNLKIGLIVTTEEEKSISSREAMERTRKTSPLFASWPQTVQEHLSQVLEMLRENYSRSKDIFDFKLFGSIVEQNALSMHATMIAAQPSILYWNQKTLEILHCLFQLRKQHPEIEIYATMDAGPHIKLLFLQHQEEEVMNFFCRFGVRIVDPLWN